MSEVIRARKKVDRKKGIIGWLIYESENIQYTGSKNDFAEIIKALKERKKYG